MLGDLIDLATPTGTPFCPNDSKEPQLPQVNADEDVFEFAKLPDQNSPQGTLLTPPFHTKNNWVTDDEAVYSEAGKYKLDVDHGGKDTRAGVDQLTPRLCADTAPMELECPPTCPLQIPPTPALTPTPAPAAAVNLASSHRNAMTLPAFDTAALAAAASEERAAAPAEADCETTCMQLETLETSSAAGSRSVRGAVASEEEPCPSSSREGVLATEKELEELKAKLAKVEASRDSIARDLGHQKGSLAKLEGTVSSLDKRLKIQVQENQALKARLADAERAAAVASVAADVTPDRCRSSVRAMHEEALRAQEVARQREAQVHKLQQLMAHEAEEMAQLQAFESQERAMLLASQTSLQQALVEQGSHVAALLQQQGQSREREAMLEAELQKLRKEVWDTKNQNIELVAEAQHIHGVATAVQAAAVAAQQQAVEAHEAQARCAAELATVRDAGVKLFKQIRAVVHALERNVHHFHKVPEVGLSIRQLHDWCAKHGPFWVEKGEEAAAAAAGAAAQMGQGSQASSAAGPGAASSTVPAHPHGSHVQAASGGGDETMTISLGHVMALGAGSTNA